MSDERQDLPAIHPDTQVTTPHGDLIGFAGVNGSHAWLGIPYAEPPVGELRWRSPRPLSRWAGKRSALVAGPPSLQRQPMGLEISADPYQHVGAEDCLYLNIWAPPMPPSERPSQKLPVMFWVHGGANMIGRGDTYDGGKLAVAQNVIVVTANYRLGLFGWCAHPALRAESASPEDRSGNFGILDLIRALEWVRDGIAGFGGDPRNVTIFGESAGGWNVFALLASPLASGLFHRAIMQSGGDITVRFADGENFTDDPVPGEPRSSNEILAQLLTIDGTTATRTDAKRYLNSADPMDVAGYLRGKSFPDFLRAYDRIAEANVARHSATGFPHLFRDGAVLPAEGICAAIAAGRYNKVPVILGTTRDEYRLMLPISGGTTFVRPLAQGMAFAIDDKARYLLASEYLSRLWKAESVDQPAAMLHRHQPGQVFAYRFDWSELKPAPWMDGIALGACHGLDLPFVFGHLKLGPEFIQVGLFDADNLESYAALSDAMMSYWAEFARSGDPAQGAAGLQARWSAWGSAGNRAAQTMMLLDSAANGGSRMSCDTVTKDQLLIELETDPRIASQEERCRLLRDLTTIRLGWRFTNEDYTGFMGGICARSMPL